MVTESSSLPTNFQFRSVEQLDETVHDLGWETDYRQLQRGSFDSRSSILEGDDWFIMEEQSSRTVEVQCPPPEGMYAIALVEGNPGVLNGKLLNEQQLFLQTPGSDVRATLQANMKVIQIGVSVERFDEVARAVAADNSLPVGWAGLIGTPTGRLAPLLKAMRSTLYLPAERGDSRRETVSALLAEMATLLAEYGENPTGHVVHRPTVARAVSKARNFIEANLDKTLEVEALCLHAGTNLRALERAFQREVGLSPKQYIKVRRLNAVHKR